MGAANGESADWTVCRLLRYCGISEITSHRFCHRERPALGCAGTSQFSAEARTASLLVESGTLFRRKGSWNFLYVLSRNAESELAGSRTDRLGDGPCTDSD